MSSLASRASSVSRRRRPSRSCDAKVSLDSQILAEQFYFFTVVIMWLIHVGFMAYEAGVARRKNIMSTAMKNILTIAVVTPSFYYFGWYIYGCFEPGGPAQGHSLDGPGPEFPGFCGATAPWAEPRWARTSRITSAPSSSWRSCSSPGRPARSCPARSSSACGSPPTCSSPSLLGSAVWIMDAAWGWSSGGWLVTNYGFHDSIASLVVHGVAGAFTLGVLLNLGPRIGKFDHAGESAGPSDRTTRI